MKRLAITENQQWILQPLCLEDVWIEVSDSAELLWRGIPLSYNGSVAEPRWITLRQLLRDRLVAWPGDRQKMVITPTGRAIAATVDAKTNGGRFKSLDLGFPDRP